MNKFYASCIAAFLAVGTLSASAADLTPQDRSEMRERADRLQAERQRNPSWEAGRTTSPRDVRSSRNRDDMKSTTVKKTKAKRKHAKRHVKRTSSKTHGKSQRAQ
jgi:hypothetical protein